VSALTKRAAVLARDRSVRDALKQERDADDREAQLVAQIQALEGRLVSSGQRIDAMVQLSQKWQGLAAQANAPADSHDRQVARREMAWLALNTMTEDEEYRDMVRNIRGGRGR
jgi:hypothetical protein